MGVTTLLNFKYIINFLFRVWGSVHMLSHCLMPGFPLIVLFASWTYRLAFLSLGWMLKISHWVYQSNIYKKLSSDFPSQSLTSLCNIWYVQSLGEWCLWDGSVSGPCCAIHPNDQVWNRIHISLSPRLSCINMNVFLVNNQANTEIADGLETMNNIATFEIRSNACHI